MDSRKLGSKRNSEDCRAAIPSKRRCSSVETAVAPSKAASTVVALGGPSRFRGVVFHKSNSKWEARIHDCGKQRFLGYYATEEEAARVYDAAAVRLHGSGVRLNFPRTNWAARLAEPSSQLTPDGKLTGCARGTSRFRGVSWNQGCRKWRAQLCHSELVHHLGYFESEVEAALEYDRHVLKLRGTAASTNFPAANYGTAPDSSSFADGADPAESEYLGVTWDEGCGRWVAEIWDGARYQMLGAFKGQLAAARAYDCACLQMHGTAANVNFHIHIEEPLQEEQLESEHDLGSSDTNHDNLELTALEALASMSSTVEEGSYSDGSPPVLGQPCDLAGSKCGSAASAYDALARAAKDLARSPHLPSQPAPPPASSLENQRSLSRPLALDKSSHYKGVSWHKHSQKWYAYIQAGGKMRGLGYFHDQQEAARAYDAEAIKVHGKRTVLNFPWEDEPNALNTSASRRRAAPPPFQSQEAPRDARSFPTSAQKSVLPVPHDGGVTWSSSSQKWIVSVWDSDLKRKRNVGSFDAREEAVRALHLETLRASSDKSQSLPASNFAHSSGGPFRHVSASRMTASAFRFSPFQEAAHHQQSSEITDGTADATHVQLMSLEPASSVKSPLKLSHQDLSWPTNQQVNRGAGSHDVAPATQPLGSAGIPLGGPSDSNDSSGAVVGNSWAHNLGQQAEFAAAGPSLLAAEDPDAMGMPMIGNRLSALQRHMSSAARSQQTATGRAGTQHRKRPSAGGAQPQARLQYRGSSKYKGVSWSERSGKWRAQMWFGHKVHHLGFFDTQEMAARCYDEAVIELRGPTSATNFEHHPSKPGAKGALKPSVLQSLTAASLPKVTSRFRGVRWHYCNSKWEARIFNGSRQVSLGYFDGELDAAHAYDAEARKLRGPSAVVNFADRAAAGEAEAAAPQALARPLRARASLQKPQAGPWNGEADDADDEYLPSRWGRKKRRLT